MIRTQSIQKIFRTEEVETTALRDITLEIREGEFISIMGPSGCGKSTLLNILGLIDTPSSGEYHFFDRLVSGISEKERAQICKQYMGFIFQNFNLIDELTVFENVELPLVYAKVPAGERKRKVDEVLEKLNMSHRRKHYPVQLSGGQQQRVAVARAIVNSPKVIFADEPTGNLDSQNGEEVMKLLTTLNGEGTSIIMVTHSAVDAEYSHRTIKMLDGQILMEEIIRVNYA